MADLGDFQLRVYLRLNAPQFAARFQVAEKRAQIVIPGRM
jgi:hypothetical protein